MPIKKNSNSEKIRQRKQVIGIVSVAMLLLFTILAILQMISFIIWIFADLVVAAIANLLLKRVGRVTDS
jgi:hypothetical protein